MECLSLEEISKNLEMLEGWELAMNKIVKTFEFGDFKEAMDFVTEVAILAEEENHHPEIHINYNKVTLSLTTHSTGGITKKDFALAEKIEGLLS